MGNWYLPNDLKFGGQVSPTLKPREWFYYLLLNSKNVPEKMFENLIGSKSTISRVEKSLKLKGYL